MSNCWRGSARGSGPPQPCMRSACRRSSAAHCLGDGLWRRDWHHHTYQFWMIVNEIFEVRDPNTLAAIAAERKSAMLLLPYGIPIAIGSIAYFAWAGMLL